MNIDAVMLNELMELAGIRDRIDEMDKVLTFMVGECDNLTPAEFQDFLVLQGIANVHDLLDDEKFDAFQSALLASSGFEQKILSSLLLTDPYSSQPGTLPISFKLMEQRFLIDSYILGNVVYDRIICNNQKMIRLIHNPLDAIFVLGNDNALPFLEYEIDKYKYSSQLATLRYLVESYDDEFWSKSLYNSWLQAIRLLNPNKLQDNYPLFMKTVAWQQQKLNMQHSSWTQLRHDNLLYGKQSYSGLTGCSYPHGYLEPYPEFYQQIQEYATQATAFFDKIEGKYNRYSQYFSKLKDTMARLVPIAQKELDHQPFTATESSYLTGILDSVRVMDCGDPIVGWYKGLYYNTESFANSDYVVADIHTQATNEHGEMVGYVLHTGVGKVNLGIFLTDAPSNNFRPTAYIGPLMS